MTDEDKAWAANWIRHAAGDWGKGRTEDKPEEEQLRMQLRRMQQRRPQAFKWLVANNDYARRLAAAMGLLSDDPKASWQDIDPSEVRRKIRMISDSPFPLLYGKFLATALRAHASHHLGLLPPAWLDEPEEARADNIVPFKAAALDITAEFKRGPVLSDA